MYLCRSHSNAANPIAWKVRARAHAEREEQHQLRDGSSCVDVGFSSAVGFGLSALDEIRAEVPGLEEWQRNVFTVMGGFMAGAGVLTVVVAVDGEPRRSKWTSWAVALVGLLTVALMRLTNFSLDSDFKWLLLAPGARLARECRAPCHGALSPRWPAS